MPTVSSGCACATTALGLESTGAGRPHEGFGLRSIRERVTVLGGYVTLGQAGHAGTVLDVVLS